MCSWQYFYFLQIKAQNMKISDIIPLRDSVYEIEKGDGNRKLEDGDFAELLFGGIEAAPTPKTFLEDDDVL